MMLAWMLAACLQDGWTKHQVGYETVEVYRDSYGVPHIFAPGIEAAFWTEGYTEAEDRWNQMDRFRRAAKGEIAELEGKNALANDLDVRLHGYTESERRKMSEAMGGRTRRIFESYAAGVNAFLQDRKVDTREWTVTDSVAIGIMMARKFGEAGDLELKIQQVYSMIEKKLGAEKAKLALYDIVRTCDSTAPTTKHDHLQPPSKEGGFFRPGVPMEGYAEFRRFLDEAEAAREAMGVPTYFGSNAWVVAPAKSASGRAMLYGGPMMGFRLPSICNEIHLVAEGMNAAGMSFPGVPGVMIGFNERIAWTTTSGSADLVDVFTLTLNEKEEYLYKGEWRKLDRIEEEIAVKDGPAEKVTILRSVHGPLVGKPDLKNLRAHTLRYSFWAQEWKTVEAVIDMNFARNLKEFETAAKKIVTSHNFFVADADGAIGFWYCGAHPKRKKGHDPRFPQPGDGSMDWEGILSPDEWPQSVNPKHGFFANWNNKPSRDWEPSAFGKTFWGKKIIDDLEAKEKLTFEEFEAIARRTAYHSWLTDYFGPYVLDAARDRDEPEYRKAFDLLTKWDRMETEGDLCANIVERWIRAMIPKVFGKGFDPMIFSSRDVQRFFLDPLLYLLEGEKSAVKLQHDWLEGRDLQALSREALVEALKPGWEKLAWESPAVEFGETKVKTKKGRGTYQMTVEIGPKGPRAETVAAPGQSENLESKHARDQIGLFETWTYKKFVWKRDEMK